MRASFAIAGTLAIALMMTVPVSAGSRTVLPVLCLALVVVVGLQRRSGRSSRRS